MARKQSSPLINTRDPKLPNGLKVSNVIKRDPGNNLPKFVRLAAEEYGYGDSTVPWSMYVHPDDIDLAFAERAHGNGSACVMAQAGRRLGAQAIYFYRTTAWVDFGCGPILRFQIPKATYRNVIDPFDDNDKEGVLPGMYPLLPPQPSHSLAKKQAANQKRTGLITPNKKSHTRQHSERVILGAKV